MIKRAPFKSNVTPKKPSNVYRRRTHAASMRPHDWVEDPTVPCTIKAKCGSCKYVNDPYETGLSEKYNRGIETLKSAEVVGSCRLQPPVKSPRTLEYRTLFKLAVRPTEPGEPAVNVSFTGEEIPNRMAIGLFQPGSHDVVNMDECPLHTAPLKRLLRDLRRELNLSTLNPFSESDGSGDIRYLAARAAHLTGEIILTFVVTDVTKKAELRKISESLQRRGHRITSTYMNIQPALNNAIFGAETIRISGTDRLRERLCDLDFDVGPTSFFQINPWQAINLYRRVEHFAGPTSGNEVAWDLFCGTGQMAQILARQGYRVLGIEENEKAVLDAEANAKKNKLSERTLYLAARVEDSEMLIPNTHAAPSLIIVNPSRRGLAQSTRTHLAKIMKKNPRCRVLYVSCEVETLSRDLKDLLIPGFQLRQLEAFDMFPQTTNMEWLALISP